MLPGVDQPRSANDLSGLHKATPGSAAGAASSSMNAVPGRRDIGRVAISTTDLSRTIAASKADVAQLLRCRSRIRQHVPAATQRWHMRKAGIALRILATT